jgi:hypothetical protein
MRLQSQFTDGVPDMLVRRIASRMMEYIKLNVEKR